jgi:hypothetical protein
MFTKKQTDINKDIVNAIKDNDMGELQKILSGSNKNDLFKGILAYHIGNGMRRDIFGQRSIGDEEGAYITCPLSQAIMDKNDQALAVLLRFLYESNFMVNCPSTRYKKEGRISISHNWDSGYYPEFTGIGPSGNFRGELNEMSSKRIDKVSNTLELYFKIDYALADKSRNPNWERENLVPTDRMKSLRGIKGYDFSNFSLDYFKSKYLDNVGDDKEKRLACYRILDAFVKSKGPVKDRNKAKRLMAEMQAQHHEKAGIHYLDNKSKLGDLLLRGDKETVARLMFDSTDSAKEINNKEIANFVKENVSLDVQLALFEIVEQHNTRARVTEGLHARSPDFRVKMASTDVWHAIVNFFKHLLNANVNDKKLGEVAQELESVFALSNVIDQGSGTKNFISALKNQENSKSDWKQLVEDLKVLANNNGIKIPAGLTPYSERAEGLILDLIVEMQESIIPKHQANPHFELEEIREKVIEFRAQRLESESRQTII